MHLWHQKKNPSILMLHRLNRAHRNAVTALMAQYHLQDVGNPMLLFILSKGLEEGAVLPSQKQLAQWLHVSPATVANSLKSLERGGYVHKEPDAQDARRNRVSITEKGRQAVLECVKVFEALSGANAEQPVPAQRGGLSGGLPAFSPSPLPFLTRKD